MTDLPCTNCGLTEETGCRCWESTGSLWWLVLFLAAVLACCLGLLIVIEEVFS